MAILFDGNTQVGGVTTLPVRAEDVSYGDSNVGSALDGVNSKLSQFEEATYTTDKLTLGNNVTFVAGGYCKIGKLVIFNIRINVGVTGTVTSILGLPKPADQAATFVPLTSEPKTRVDGATINRDGTVIFSCIATGPILLTGSYICQ